MPNELTVEELVKAMRLCAEKTKNGETCVTGQKDCPFGVTVMDCTERMNLATADALESLAAERDAYRDKLKAALAENTRLAEKVNRAQQPSKPLTVKELRQMIGQWVWVESKDVLCPNGWYRVEPQFHETISLAGVDGTIYETSIANGDSAAYRRPPEAGAINE